MAPNEDTSRNKPSKPRAKKAVPKARQILTVRETAAYLRVHPGTIYRLAKRSSLPAFKVGSDWRFASDILDRWLQEQSASGKGLPRSPRVKRKRRWNHN